MNDFVPHLVRFGADGLLIIVLVTAALMVIREYGVGKKLWNRVPTMIMAGLTSLLIGKLLSLLYQPAVARPFLELGVEPGAAYVDNPGFPSDHALLATVVVVAVAALLSKRRYWIILGGLVLVMGAARIAAHVHTPLDVAGGVMAGLAGGLWYLQRR